MVIVRRLILAGAILVILSGCATLMGPVALDHQNRGVELIYGTPARNYEPLKYLSNDKCAREAEALWWLQLKAQEYKADAVIGVQIRKDPWLGRYWVSGLAVKWVEGGEKE